MFLLKVSAKELFQGDGMDFDVMDFDTIGSDEKLGHAHVDPLTLFHCNGERLKLKLDGDRAQGSLAVRFRRATKSDEVFMEKKEDKTSDESMKIIHAESKKKLSIESMISRNVKVERFGMGPPVKKVSNLL
jgi:Ca2+-dependent lipid-binding protein